MTLPPDRESFQSSLLNVFGITVEKSRMNHFNDVGLQEN